MRLWKRCLWWLDDITSTILGSVELNYCSLSDLFKVSHEDLIKEQLGTSPLTLYWLWLFVRRVLGMTCLMLFRIACAGSG